MQHGGPLRLILTQSGTSVTGSLAWSYVTAPVTGTFINRRLTIGRWAPSSTSMETGFEHRSATVSGNTMSGTFAIRFGSEASPAASNTHSPW